ncbi:MAG: EVE domain-containing protein [Bacteroidetes bacterium]|nr:MAG: EVE domain-containing protein [Bacteroidota bacterium]
MGYWLVKSEPFKYSWQQFVAEKETYWDGVRNYAARNHLRAMHLGDEVLFYHSNEGLEIVGIAKVVREAYPDPTAEPAEANTWSVVNLAPVKALKQPVSLATIKADARLANMQIIKLSRLSVSMVTEEEWDVVMELGGMV